MAEPLLYLRNGAIYQEETLVLSAVNIEIFPGDFIYLIGKTGSGKSSFMKVLYGDLPLKSGEGKVVDIDLRTLKQKQIPYLRRKLGIVFQDFKLLPDRSVIDNLYFVLKATGWKDKSQMEERIGEVLDKVGMRDKERKMPHQLSGGEQQRIAIARALLNKPDIILADEPTGNLDPQTSVEVMEVLRELNKNGNTILMSTHDYALILKYPYKTYKCDGQRVFEVVQKSV